MSEQNNSDNYSEESIAVLAQARQLSKHYRHAYITPEHVLLGILEKGGDDALKIVKRGKATTAQMTKLVEHHLREGENDIPLHVLNYSERAKRVLDAARAESARQNAPAIAPRHLLAGLSKVPNTVAAAVLGAVDLKGDDIFS